MAVSAGTVTLARIPDWLVDEKLASPATGLVSGLPTAVSQPAFLVVPPVPLYPGETFEVHAFANTKLSNTNLDCSGVCELADLDVSVLYDKAKVEYVASGYSFSSHFNTGLDGAVGHQRVADGERGVRRPHHRAVDGHGRGRLQRRGKEGLLLAVHAPLSRRRLAGRRLHLQQHRERPCCGCTSKT